MDIVERNLSKHIQAMTGKYPILALTGPRQSGKTTLLRNMFEDYRYVSLENPDIRNFAEVDTKGFFKYYDDKVIFDEVQRVPKLFSYMQGIVDENRKMGQFILSGSQNFHLMQNITQSLAGRVALFKLFPFDFSELKLGGWLNDSYEELMIKGFYPALYNRGIDSSSFYSNYLQTYVQRDVSELIAIKDMSTFRRFVVLCAARAGQLLNLSALANQCGISQPTAKAWLSALESSYIVFLLYPYYKNFSKRVVKTPKLYFYDSGLLSHLLKINRIEQVINESVKGVIFENMVVSEYYKQMYHNNITQTDMWFWRDTHGNEVDLFIQRPEYDEAIEIKATQTVMYDLFKGLNYYSNLVQDESLRKSLVYGGLEYQERNFASVIPWQEIKM